MYVFVCTFKMEESCFWGRNRKKVGLDGMEGKEKGSYLRLIPGQCLEDKMN